jgi:nucleoside phosphorylase
VKVHEELLILNRKLTRVSDEKKVRVVILTAFPVEFEAVVSRLDDVKEVVHRAGTIYSVGTYQGDTTWKAAVAEVGAGNPRTAHETERAIQLFHPEVAIFVGVAGGLKDVGLGDVVASTKVYGFESGKVGHEFLARPEVHTSAYALEQRCRAQSRKAAWLKARRNSPSDSPRAFVGPIAAGSSVIASTEAALYQFLRRSYGDALAVEMEGYGFTEAVRACHPVQAVVIRGISDLVDGKSEADAGGSQEKASENAAAYAFDVLDAFFKAQDMEEAKATPRSDRSTAASRKNLLLGDQFLTAVAVTEKGEGRTIVLTADSGEQAAILQQMTKARGTHVPFAYKNSGGTVKVLSIVCQSDDTGERWTVELQDVPARREMEASLGIEGRTYSIAELAGMRAQRILLNRKFPEGQRSLINTLEIFISGSGGSASGLDIAQSPLVKLFRSSSWEMGEFISRARLVAVFYLLATGTVDSIFDLTLEPTASHQVKVLMRGARFPYRGATQQDPVTVDGILELS